MNRHPFAVVVSVLSLLLNSNKPLSRRYITVSFASWAFNDAALITVVKRDPSELRPAAHRISKYMSYLSREVIQSIGH